MQIRNETCGEPIPNDFHFIIMHNDRVDECGNRVGTETKQAHFLSQAEAVDFCSSKCALDGFSIIKREIDPCSDWENCGCGIISEVTLPCGGFATPEVYRRETGCINWDERSFLTETDANPAECPAWIAAPSMNDPDAGRYTSQFARAFETVTHQCTRPNLSTCRANIDIVKVRSDPERVVAETLCAPPPIIVLNPECPRLPTPEEITWELCAPNSPIPAACEESMIDIPKQVKCRGPTSNKKKFCKAEYPSVTPVQSPCMANSLIAANIRPDPAATQCAARSFFLTGLITKSALSVCPEYCVEPSIIPCQFPVETEKREDICQCNNQNCAGQLQSFGWGRTWSRCLGVKNTWCSISRNGQVSTATTLPTQECCDPVQETITSTITEPTNPCGNAVECNLNEQQCNAQRKCYQYEASTCDFECDPTFTPASPPTHEGWIKYGRRVEVPCPELTCMTSMVQGCTSKCGMAGYEEYETRCGNCVTRFRKTCTIPFTCNVEPVNIGREFFQAKLECGLNQCGGNDIFKTPACMDGDTVCKAETGPMKIPFTNDGPSTVIEQACTQNRYDGNCFSTSTTKDCCTGAIHNVIKTPCSLGPKPPQKPSLARCSLNAPCIFTNQLPNQFSDDTRDVMCRGGMEIIEQPICLNDPIMPQSQVVGYYDYKESKCGLEACFEEGTLQCLAPGSSPDSYHPRKLFQYVT